MVIVAGQHDAEPCVHTGPFGKVPKRLIDSTVPGSLDKMGSDIFGTPHEPRELIADEAALAQIDDFRVAVGAVYLSLKQKIEADIAEAYLASDSLWKAMLVSLFSRRLRPQKYYALCGRPGDGYGGNVTQLANMPFRDELVKRWQIRDWDAHVSSVWKTKNALMEKEQEYRNAAMAVYQIGIGVGGMVLGLVGLLLSIIAPLLMAG